DAEMQEDRELVALPGQLRGRRRGEGRRRPARQPRDGGREGRREELAAREAGHGPRGITCLLMKRRHVLLTALAGAPAFTRRGAARESASQPKTPVAFAVPPDACDCHTHVFGDPTTFPMAPTRTYTPEPASIDELRALHRALHLDRVVVVHPSVYGTDNRC